MDAALERQKIYNLFLYGPNTLKPHQKPIKTFTKRFPDLDNGCPIPGSTC